jgi:hypothetical protein
MGCPHSTSEDGTFAENASIPLQSFRIAYSYYAQIMVAIHQNCVAQDRGKRSLTEYQLSFFLHRD